MAMNDAVSELRYHTLRTKLNDLNYFQPLSVESTLLVEKLLQDLLKSVENFQGIRRQSDGAEKELESTRRVVVAAP